MQAIDVLGIGNAFVDLVVEVDDETVARHDLPRDDMLLTDAARFDGVYRDVEPITHVSYGGNACNTMGGLASFGFSARFVGKIADDELGRIFAEAVRAAGVAYDTPPVTSDAASASCLILVTPDGQRTGVTHLGACGELGVADVTPDAIAAARLVFVESYLLDTAPSTALMWRIPEMTRAAGRPLAITLSDPNCVRRNGDGLRAFLAAGHVDILFANESEARTMTGAADFDAAVAMLAAQVPVLAVTRGSRGSIVATGGTILEVPAQNTAVVDSTGAGDLFASGFLAGHLLGAPPAECAALGAEAAAAIIGHLGTRPRSPLASLLKQVA